MSDSKSTEKQDYYWHKVEANDKANQALLSQLITKDGWPTTTQFGASGSLTAWLIVWHADRSYQRRYYPLIKQAFQQGAIQKSYLELAH